MRELVAYARSIGVTAVQVHNGGKHPALTGTLPGGRALRYTLPSSPRDPDVTAMKAQADLRRMIRVAQHTAP